MFGAIGEVFGGIFGTKKAVENILNKDTGILVRAGGFFNDLHHSDAEKARSDAEQRQWGIRQLEALAPFKVVQRILAFAATALWGFIGLNVVIGMWIEAFYPDFNIVNRMLEFALSDYIFMPVALCYGLYFGGGVIESFNRKKG